jgi:hypothetical protein
MKTIWALALLALVAHAVEQISPVPVGRVVEGTYAQRNGFQTTIVELKEGRYRYWFSSDMKIGGEVTAFPLSGPYTAANSEVTFVVTNTYVNYSSIRTNGTGLLLSGSPDLTPGALVKTNVRHFLITNRWTFMNHDGKTTLWRPDAIRDWEQTKRLNGYGVLFPASKKPEEIWTGR